MANMNNQKIAQVKWQIYRCMESLSLVAKIALVFFALLLLIYVWTYRPQQSNLERLITINQMVKLGVNPVVNSPEADLSLYKAQFPSLATRAVKINTLIDMARQQNLLLDEVMYKTETNSNQPLNHYQMAFSVFAPYPQIHYFLSSVLAEMPYVAVSSLTISRENVLEEVVEARVQLIFYFDNVR
jgi:hypothetical protein